MQFRTKSNDIFTQQIHPATQLHIFTLNSNETKFSIIKNNFISKKGNKTFRIQLKQNQKLLQDKIIKFFKKFKVIKLIMHYDGVFQQICFDILKNLQFQQIKVTIEQNKNSLQSQSENHLKFDHQQQGKLFIRQFQILTEKFISNLLKSKTKFNLLQIDGVTSLNELQNALEVIKSHEQQNLNNFWGAQDKIQNQFFAKTDLCNLKKTEQTFQQSSTQKSLQSTLCEPTHNRKYKYTVRTNEYTQQTLFLMIKNWLQNLCSTKTKEKLEPYKLLNQAIIINSADNQHLLTLLSNSAFGVDLHISHQLFSLGSLCKLLESLLLCSFFVSLEMRYLPKNFQRVLQMFLVVFQNRKKCLIKILNHIELTPTRITINSTNLPASTVTMLFKLIQQVNGYFEFVFYGSKQYLHQACKLFQLKPFVKFNYFMPIDQLTNENQTIIQRMERDSQDLKRKVLQFRSMMKNHTRGEINLIKDVFMALHLD